MRLRRPAIAATSLGLAGALLPASGAVAETDRHHEYREEVTFQTPSGEETCTLVARLDWTFGDEGPQDDVLSASTSAEGCNVAFPSWAQATVTLRWTTHEFRRSQRHTHTSEGDMVGAVSTPATPLDPDTHFGTDGVSSEHHVEFTYCDSNCEWSHTLTTK
jgi:hypothetical protein